MLSFYMYICTVIHNLCELYYIIIYYLFRLVVYIANYTVLIVTKYIHEIGELNAWIITVLLSSPCVF